MFQEMMVASGGGGGDNIDLSQQNLSISTTNNLTEFTGLDTSKYYCAFGYQYKNYANLHGAWTDADIKTVLGQDARLIGSYTESSNSYTVTAIIFKPQSSSVSIALGYNVQYYPIT